MKKSTIIITVIAVLVIIAIIIAVVVGKSNKTALQPINSAEDLSALVDKIYEGEENILSSLQTQVIDVKDADLVKMITGLENGDKLEYLVASEPMISSQAYSLILAKVNKGENANEVAKNIFESVNPSKWICVSAEKIYATNSGDVVFVIMSSEEWAKPLYEKFKKLAENIGQEYEKTVEEPNLDTAIPLPL